MDEQILKDFFDFLLERHAIYIKRFEQKLPPPWTNDPILSRYRFCNIYRDLDRGTIYYKEQTHDTSNESDLIFQTIIYRMINNVRTFKFIGGIPHMNTNLERLEQKLRDSRRDNKIFLSRAYRTMANSKKGDTKIDTFMDLVREVLSKLDNLTTGIKMTQKIPFAWEVLQTIKHIGKFAALQIVWDLAERFFFSTDEWVYVGSGSRPAIARIFNAQTLKTEEDYIEGIKKIQTWLKQQSWSYKPLTLCDVQHSLCEWRKHFYIKNLYMSNRIFHPANT